jgi:hypothetical protein
VKLAKPDRSGQKYCYDSRRIVTVAGDNFLVVYWENVELLRRVNSSKAGICEFHVVEIASILIGTFLAWSDLDFDRIRKRKSTILSKRSVLVRARQTGFKKDEPKSMT